MSNTLFIKAEEIAEEMGVSIPYAYKLIRKLNGELTQKGFITVSGRVSRAYYKEKIYCNNEVAKKGVLNGSI